MHSSAAHDNRLSVFYLLCLTAGVGMAFSIARTIEWLRFPADAIYYRVDHFDGLDARSAMIASVYGVCVTTFLFAWRSGNFWSSPGKILALLFATMCALDWAFELLAAIVMHYRMQAEFQAGTPDTRGFIGGIWYRNLAPTVGYIVGLPIVALVVYQTRAHAVWWRSVWIGFFVFALLIIASMHFNAPQYLPIALQAWYFEIAIGLPVVLLSLALTVSLWRRERPDWWTTITAPLIILAWATGVALKVVR